MPNAYAQRLSIRLFVEGIEIPVISANVQAAPNSPAVASIQIPPLAEGTRFLPRSTVHLFFLDMYSVQSPFLTETGVNADKPGGKNPTVQEKNQQLIAQEGEGLEWDDFQKTDGYQTFVNDAFNSKYKLLFAGEVVGFSWTKNVVQRSLVLQCEDFSNYWDYAYQADNTGLFGPGIKAIFSGAATNLFTDVLAEGKGSYITQLLLSGKSNTFPNLTGLAAGVIRLIESIGGTYFPAPGSNGKRISGQNIFFSLAELRLKITHTVMAFEDDPTSKTLMARAGYGSMFNRALGGLGGQTSIRQALNAITKVIFHEMYPQPCPMFVSGTEGDVQGLKRTKFKDHPKWGFIVTTAEGAINTLEGVKGTLEAGAGRAELSLVIGPFISDITIKLQKVVKLLKSSLVMMRNAPAPASRIFTTASGAASTAATKVKSWKPGMPANDHRAIVAAIQEAIDQLAPIKDLTVNEKSSKESSPARLQQQIFRPDIWFGSPIRCNVLFPENYETLQYQRSFLQEPTRFLLKTNDEFFGEDFLFDKLYFAPQSGGTARADHSRLRDMLTNNLLDHELFTGILPIHEKMGEFNIFAGRAGQNAGTVPKVSAAQRSANFLYFKHRFNARRMQITGKFNPYIAAGCPGLIIDKHVNSETIAIYNELKRGLVASGKAKGESEGGLVPQEVSELLGTNFLGNFTQISHSVSQEALHGKTTIVCSYPRQSEESIEFLGAVPEAQRVQKKVEEAAVRGCVVAALSPPQLFSLGPNLGRITAVHDVTSRYTTQSGQLTTTEKLPLWDIGSPQSSRKNPVLVPVGIEVVAEDLGTSSRAKVEEIAGGPDVPIVFRAYALTEEIARYRKEDVLISAEEFIRPGWYGDVWSPSKIGKVYNEFFGVGSITDATTISGPEKADQAAEEQQAEDADDPRGDAPAALALEEGATIQDAVEFLHLTYSYIRQTGLSTEEFIAAYTWRPIATLVDMFGSADLEFSKDGMSVVKGAEGFHSRAFGPYENLFGLANPEIEDIIGIRRDSINNTKVDTRLRKYRAVQKYASVIRFSRAILG